MYLWTKKSAPLFRKLKSCSDEQLMILAIKGFQHAFERNRLLFQAAPRKELKVVKAALNQARRAYKSGKGHDKLAAFVEVILESSERDSGVPGWFEAVQALYEIVYFHRSRKVAKRFAKTSLGYSYISVMQPEMNDLMLTQGMGLVGDEIAEAEESLEACHKEIEFQKGLIDELVKGKKLSL